MMEQIGKTYRNTEDTEAEENTVNKMGIQTDVENDGRNVSSGSNEEDNQDNDLITQGVEELKDNTFRPKSNANVQFMLKNGEKVQAKVLIKQPVHFVVYIKVDRRLSLDVIHFVLIFC